MNLDQWVEANPEWTDERLAARVGVSRPYISRVRRRERQPSLKVALRLAEITNLPAAAFLKTDEAA